MKGPALAGLLLLGQLALACREQQPPAPAPAMPAPPAASVSAAVSAPSPECIAADLALRKAAARPKDEPDYLGEYACVPEIALRAAARCPSLADRARAIATQAEQTDRLAGTTGYYVTEDERWLVQRQESRTRLWSLSADGPRLAFRLAGRESWEAAPDGRFVARSPSGDDLFVLDTGSGGLSLIPDVSCYGLAGRTLFVADRDTIQRYDWPTLSLLQTISASTSGDCLFRSLLEGRVLLASDKLVSLEYESVLADSLEAVTVSSDESRLAACTERDEVVVVETLTGRTLGKFMKSQPLACIVNRPTITPDGRFVITVDTLRPKGLRITSIDWATGKKRSLVDRSFLLGGHTAYAALHVDVSAPTTLCMSYDSYHHIGTVCPWTIDARGAIRFRATRPTTPSSYGVPGTELMRASSPDNSRLVIATYVAATGRDPALWHEHLRLFVVDPTARRVLRSAEVRADAFVGADGPLIPQPSLSFISPTRVLLSPGDTVLPTGVFDIETARFEPIDSDGDHSGRFAMNRAGSELIDLVTMQRYSLVPDPAAWSAAPRQAPGCAR